MSGCTHGRMVTLRFRFRDTKAARAHQIVCPMRWSKSDLLKYCRGEHPEETVVILDWGPAYGPWDERALWIAA
jgi:hypothetical protein